VPHLNLGLLSAIADDTEGDTETARDHLAAARRLGMRHSQLQRMARRALAGTNIAVGELLPEE